MFRAVVTLTGIILMAGLAVGQSWLAGPQTPFAFSRFDGEYFPGTAKVYFLGGRVGLSTTRGEVYSYEPMTGNYAATGAIMRRAVSNYDVCLLRDDHDLPAGDTYGLYIVGGRYDATPNYYDSLQVYYPTSNTTIILPEDPFPGRSGGYITVAMSAIAYENIMYVMGGFTQNANVTSKEMWRFDPLAPPHTRWTQLQDMPLARAYPILGIVDSLLFACGGDTWKQESTALYARSQCFRFNLNDTGAGWTTVAGLPGVNGEARGFGFDSDYPSDLAGNVVIAGRGVWPSESAHCYIYNVARDSWSPFPNLAQRRRNHAGVYIPPEAGGVGVPGIWVFGGRQDTDSSFLRSSEYYVIGPVGSEETMNDERGTMNVGATIVHNVLHLRVDSRQHTAYRVELLDAMGRKVLDLRPGGNDVRALTPGVYFVRERLAASRKPSAAAKVTVTK